MDALPGTEWGAAILRLAAADPVPVYGSEAAEAAEEGGEA